MEIHPKLKKLWLLSKSCDCCRKVGDHIECVKYVSCGDLHERYCLCPYPCRDCLVWSGYGGNIGRVIKNLKIKLEQKVVKGS
jgi:hypothetical protein